MVQKEYLIELLNQHRTFLIYSKTDENIINYFTWDEKNQEYEEYKDYQYENWDEMLKICQWGDTIEKRLADGEILVEHRDDEIEDEIISNYIRKDYRKRCQILLSGKKRDKFANLIQDNKQTLNLCRAEKLEAHCNLYPKLPSIWKEKKIGKKEGYLMTGFFSVDTYSGKMEQLLEFLEKHATFEMGILYCPEEKIGIMQFSNEVFDGRWYWLK